MISTSASAAVLVMPQLDTLATQRAHMHEQSAREHTAGAARADVFPHMHMRVCAYCSVVSVPVELMAVASARMPTSPSGLSEMLHTAHDMCEHACDGTDCRH